MKHRLAGLLAVVLAVTSCGVSVDESPRALELPRTTTTVGATPSTGRFETPLYYVAESELLPVIEDLSDRGLDTVVRALLEPHTDADGTTGLGSSIPAGTELLGVERRQRALVVDLSEAFDNVVGVSRQQAIGQIVLTVTDSTGIDTVTFRVEGRPVTVSSPVRGDSPSVGPCDYQPLLGGLQTGIDAGLPVRALEKLADRLADLGEECGDPRATSRAGG